jgi:hypothetical protein
MHAWVSADMLLANTQHSVYVAHNSFYMLSLPCLLLDSKRISNVMISCPLPHIQHSKTAEKRTKLLLLSLIRHEQHVTCAVPEPGSAYHACFTCVVPLTVQHCMHACRRGHAPMQDMGPGGPPAAAAQLQVEHMVLQAARGRPGRLCAARLDQHVPGHALL